MEKEEIELAANHQQDTRGDANQQSSGGGIVFTRAGKQSGERTWHEHWIEFRSVNRMGF